MKVAVYHNNNDIRIEERPKPKISDGEILVKVRASGICGTDVMEWYRIKKAPRVLGHEIAGDVVESKSDKFKVLTNLDTCCDEQFDKTKYPFSLKKYIVSIIIYYRYFFQSSKVSISIVSFLSII